MVSLLDLTFVGITMAFLEMLLLNFYASNTVNAQTRILFAAGIAILAPFVTEKFFGVIEPVRLFAVTAILFELPIVLFTNYETIPSSNAAQKMIVVSSFMVVSYIIGKFLSDSYNRGVVVV